MQACSKRCRQDGLRQTELARISILNPNPAPKSLTSRIHQDLRADILACRLVPSAKIRIADLQKRFGASLSVVREALSRLSTEELVDASDQRGFRVADVSAKDLEDLTRTRRQIEGIAMRQAIEMGDGYWEAAVNAAYADLVVQDQRVRGNKAWAYDPDWIRAHDAYHLALISGCDSPTLIRVCTQLSERMQRYRALSVDLAPHRNGHREHRQLVQAVLSRDAKSAVTILDEHFAETARILTEATGHIGQSASQNSSG